jgi:hypothetical protein
MHEARAKERLATINAVVAAAAAQSKNVAWCHNLPHTQVRQSLAGSPGGVSGECCLGEVYSLVAEVEVECTRETRHMRAPALRSEEEMAGSKTVPDAPSHSHTRPAPVNENGRV